MRPASGLAGGLVALAVALACGSADRQGLFEPHQSGGSGGTRSAVDAGLGGGSALAGAGGSSGTGGAAGADPDGGSLLLPPEPDAASGDAGLTDAAAGDASDAS